MTLTMKLRAATLLAALLSGIAPACAELPVDLEVATEKGVPLAAPQEWAQLLGELELASVRVRGGRGDDQPAVTQSVGPRPRFEVLAVLNARGELVLPERRFRMSDRKLLAAYFQALGQSESFGKEIGPFGLTQEQFATVFEALSPRAGISTRGNTPAEVLNQLTARIELTVFEDPRAREALQTAKPLAAELRDLSTGTTLAITLRNAGLVLRPDKPIGKPLRLVVEPYRPEVEVWPVGWKSEGSPRLAAPQLFEFLTIEVSGSTLANALEALQPRMGVKVFYDDQVLTARGIDPAKIDVKFPSKKTYLKRVVDQLLSQGRLAGELRVDEVDQPFYWITQFGADSPRAK